MKRFFAITAILIIGICATSQASHLKAAKVTYKHIQGLSFLVTVTLYSDMGSAVAVGTSGVIDFGDGTTATLDPENAQVTQVGNHSWEYKYAVEHTFPQGNNYFISYSENYRNNGILNIGSSVNVPFYLESLLAGHITTANSSPTLQNPPVGTAYFGETFYYNPMATDPDGDSLSYYLVPSKQAKGEPVPDYSFPHKTFEQEGGSETGETAYLVINPVTGDIVWDSPTRVGEYNVALEIREWRSIDGEYIQIGAVEQDMQIIVNESSSPGLQLEFPVESQLVQLEAGQPLAFSIRAIPENPEDTVILELSGDFLREHPTAASSDSVGGKGTQSLSIQYTPGESVNERYQLIATASLYDTTKNASSRSRAAYFLTPGFVNGIKEAVPASISVYPNPSTTNRFYLNTEKLNNSRLSLSLFDTGGRLVHQQEFASFSTEKAVTIPGNRLQGTYLLLIWQGDKLYSSRLTFLPK